MSDRSDYLKQEQDFLKHLTSLSTGSILLLTTFLEKLFLKPLWKPLIWTALLGFTVSIITTLVIHILSIVELSDEGDKIKTRGIFLFFLSFGGFITGIVCLVIFSIKNLTS